MISVGIASLPERRMLLYQALDSLLPQVDRIGVYLDGYDEIPDFCINPKIDVARSQEPSLGDAGKFFWASHAEGYYFTCDDDLLYLPGYVDSLLAGIERYERHAVCSFHGAIFGIDAPTTFSRQVFPCLGSVYADFSVHTLGTGVMGFHTDTCRPPLEIFEHPNMADIWFGAWAQKHKLPLVVLMHRSPPVAYLDPGDDTIWDHSHSGSGTELDTHERQSEVVRSLRWQTFDPR